MAACEGQDLLAELRQANPAAFQVIEDRADGFAFRHGRLFRVSSETNAPSFLFGTLHLADPRVAELPADIASLLANAATLVVESADIGRPQTARQRQELRDALYARPEQQSARLLDRESLSSLSALARLQGVSAYSVRFFKPAALALLLDMPQCARSRGQQYLDALLVQEARNRGKAVVGLETIAEQINALDGLGPEAERALLLSVIRGARIGPSELETQILRYGEQDLGMLLSWMMAPHPVPGAAEAMTPPAFLDRLVRRRSERMSSRLMPLLARGSLFIAVGAAHIPGPYGLAALLQAAGFKVEQVQ